MRILTLGLNNSGKTAIINRLKLNETIETEPTQGFNVTAVDFNSNRFTLWEVGGDQENRNTFKQHTNNTHGIIYVVDVSTPELFNESKEQLELALNDRALSGAPLLIYANKVDQGGNLQQVIDDLGLNQVNDREWYIQGSNGISGVGVNQGFDWLTKNLLSKNNKSYTFDAQPKVVRSQAKYKPSNEQDFISESQRTFVKLIKDPRIITMDPIEQENEYIKLEKERITYENMKEQLKNFKKNKNKQTPYEIKPSPNPRIEVNLEFFLTDHNNLIVPQTKDVNEQTDAFTERPATPPYVPKKTGIDAQTQVEDFELFVFDREVTPIVDVIVSKICEQSLLEIEQEKELQKMREFKRQFMERREEDMEKQRDILTKEVELIQQKNERLYKYSEKEYRVRATLRRTQAYAIAGQFLQNMQKNTFEQIYKHGIYQNTLEQNLKTKFMPWLIEETCKNIQKNNDMSKKMLGLFDQHCITPILEKQNPILEQRNKKKARVNLRRVNEGKEQKYIRIFYNQVHLQQSNFVKNFQRFSDGTLEDFQANYAARVAELKDKIEMGDIQEDEYQKIMDEEFPDTIGWGFQISSIKKLAFTLAHNQYYKTLESQKNMQLLAYCLSSDSEIQYTINKKNLRPQTDNPQTNKFIRYKTNIRDPYRRIDNDEAIIVDFDKIPENVQTIFIFTQISNLQNIANNQQEVIPYAQFGVEDWKYNIGVDKVQISDIAKLEEIIKPVDQGQEEQSAYIFSYVLTKQKDDKWIIESIKQTKAFYDYPLPPQEDQDQEQQQQNNNQQLNSSNQQQQTELEQYIDLIREFWGKQDGSLKNQKISLNDQEEDEANQQQQQQQENIDNEDEDNLKFNQLGQPRVTGQFSLDLKLEDMEQIQLILEQQIEKLDPEFVSSCTNGYSFYYKDQPLEKHKQLKKIKNVQDLEVRANPPPPPEPAEDEGEEGEEGEQDGENSDE